MASALATSSMSVVGATAPSLRAHLGVSTAALTVAFVAQMLGGLIGSWIAGVARHRILELTPMALLAALALTAAMAAPELALLVAAMLVAGVAGFVANAGAQAETMRRAGAGRARALSQYHIWGGAGAAGFPLVVAALLAAGVPWRSGFALVAAGYLAYALINRRERIVRAPRDRSARRPPVGPRARWSIAVAVLGGGLQFTFPLYLASLLVDRFGASDAVGSAGISVYAFAILAVRVGGTRLFPVFPPDRQLQLSCALLGVGFALLAAASSAGAAIVAAAFLGAGVGQCLPLGMARTGRDIGDERYATGLVFSINSAAQMTVPAVVALMLGVVDLQTALVLLAPIAAVIAVAVWRSGRPLSAVPGTRASPGS
jgi:MFS family permease